MPKYCTENFHLIDGKQVGKIVNFLAPSDDEAKKRFTDMRKKDSTIQESVFFKVKGGTFVDEYVGYY